MSSADFAPLAGASKYLACYVANRIVESSRQGSTRSVQEVLEECSSAPYQELAEEASGYLESGTRTGSVADGPACVTPTAWSSDPDAPGMGTLQVHGYSWATYDYGEQLHTSPAVQAALGL